MASAQRVPQGATPATPRTPVANPGSGKSRTQTLEFDTDNKPRFRGCSNLKDYEILDKLGEGTFGEVHKARHRVQGGLYALKKILMHNEKDGFPITALREIRLLKMLSHQNVLQLKEMAVEHINKSGKAKSIMHMVMPYMSHDLSGLLENTNVRITEPIIKCYMLQLLKGVEYLHASRILHRDMKAANLLISNHGVLQIADFGLARQYEEEPPKPGRGAGEAIREYTHLVVTRWYRPPELLLSLRKYTTAIDLWGVGCVFGEMFKHRPILAGSSDLKQANLIFDLVGSPTEQNMPGFSSLPGCESVNSWAHRKGNIDEQFGKYSARPEMLDLLKQLLTLDWRKRVTAIDALKHPYFKVPPLPARPDEIPQFEESHEFDRRKNKQNPPEALPPAPAGGTVGMGHPPGEWGHAQNGHGRRPPGHANGRYNNGPGYGGPDRRDGRDGRDGRDAREGRDGRRPAWERGPPPPNTALPAKTPPSNDLAGWGSGGPRPNPTMPVGRQPRGRAPQGGPPGAGAGGNVDTYIPSYDDRPPRDDRPLRDERLPRDDRGPPRGEGRRPVGGDRGLDYGDGANDRRGERGRDRDWRDRSRSPGRRPPPDDRMRDRHPYGRR